MNSTNTNPREAQARALVARLKAVTPVIEALRAAPGGRLDIAAQAPEFVDLIADWDQLYQEIGRDQAVLEYAVGLLGWDRWDVTRLIFANLQRTEFLMKVFDEREVREGRPPKFKEKLKNVH